MHGNRLVLVIGATGNQGGSVVHHLLGHQWRIRALTRNPRSPKALALEKSGIQVVSGDLADLPSLVEAMDGADGVFSIQNFWDLGLEEEVRLGLQVIKAAQAQRRGPHLIYSSGLGADAPTRVAAIEGKRTIKSQLRASGLRCTILRPALFMDDIEGASLPFSGPLQRVLDRRRRLVGRLFLATLRGALGPRGRVPLTTLDDVGRVAAWALTHPDESQYQAYPLIGSVESVDSLCRTWEESTGSRIPWVPGLTMGLRLFHPQMAQLLRWLGRNAGQPTTGPISLSTYQEWLSHLPARI